MAIADTPRHKTGAGCRVIWHDWLRVAAVEASKLVQGQAVDGPDVEMGMMG